MTDIINKLKEIKTLHKTSELIAAERCNWVLKDLADLINQSVDIIIAANKQDLAKMSRTDPKYDRLELTTSRIQAIANGLIEVASFPSPLERILEEKMTPNGLQFRKITVPIGVIGIIYESRPNVSIDVFSLCFKSGNACILKGGSEAFTTNQILVNLIHTILKKHNINTDWVYLMPPEREYLYDLLSAVGLVDVCIPRGSHKLIQFVRDNAKIPVIETGAGIVHTYFDITGDLEQGIAIIHNAKTRRVSVCNALDTLIIHKERLVDLVALVTPLSNHNVELFADEESYAILDKHYPQTLLHRATKESFGHEFLDYKMAIKTVNNCDEAIMHIKEYTSGHSEAIIAEDEDTLDYFMAHIDAAVVYANASTAFTDGGEFGLGAEIGISTQKLHARGPMSLKELTSYKWLVWGNGHIRS